MKRYILVRLLKSIVSIFLVVSIVTLMLFTLIPRMNIFEKDGAYKKLNGDAKTSYVYTKLDELGYLDFVRQSEMCALASDVTACNNNDADQIAEVTKLYEEKGYNVKTMLNGTLYGYYDYKPFEILWNYFSKVIVVDNPDFVKNTYGVELENTGYYFGLDYNNIPALMCN